MGNFAKLFEGILEKPELVLGERSITKLFFYMSGATQARKMYGEQDPFYEGFQAWVVERFGISHSHSWANIILFFCYGCEYEAFDRTRELWSEYKASYKDQLPADEQN